MVFSTVSSKTGKREIERKTLQCMAAEEKGAGFPLLSLIQKWDRNQPGSEGQKSSPEEVLLPIGSF